MDLKTIRSHIMARLKRLHNKEGYTLAEIYTPAEIDSLINTAIRKFMEDTELLRGDTLLTATDGVVDISNLDTIKVYRIEVDGAPAGKLYKNAYGKDLPV